MLAVALAFVVAVTLAYIATPEGEESYAPYDPESPDLDGTRALVHVLEDHGVEVDIVRSAKRLEDTEIGRDTTVFVTGTEALGEDTASRLRDRTDGSELILADPPPYVSAMLDIPYALSQAAETIEADCDDPRWQGLSIQADAMTAYDAGSCFPHEGGAVLAPADGLTVWGAPQVLTNDQILRADNAAVALRLLGGSDRLVWYIPSFDDLAPDETHTAGSLLPPWIKPALWILLLAVVAFAIARGRRLGPLAVEPLPVHVRAAETTRSLGRLYRRSGDRRHAARTLRHAARTRLAQRLRLGREATPEAVVRAVAHRTGRPDLEVSALLTDSPIENDHDLITLANALADLEEEVRHP
ncbi:DUF4350 domain-containing protein [Nocardioides albus]|uniref:DUF4350 domain-containing protein n=1 Tax=Nocardioides albus TaxID=1841 RepID=A0A7W5F8G1_9ACTN|nr:DUF4350 domain-containing protein [Nocardioides albus]MBB3088887.1 hypothetical protein [Nocardioides albus]GGU19404.1 hypothetical protein GCM10007979_17780 [Nocardioides albus]